jgi:hypothetical protein
MLVGARYACEYCLRRGVEPQCDACGGAVVDLGAPAGLGLLHQAVGTSDIEPRRRPGVRGWWRSLPWLSRAEWLGTGVAVLASSIGMLQDVPLGWSMLWAIPFGAMMGVLARLVALILGLVLRLIGCTGLLLAAGIVAMATLGRRQRAAKRLLKLAEVTLGEKGPPRLGFRNWRHRWTLRPARVTPVGPALAGTIISPSDLRISLAEGRNGDLELADASLAPFEISSSAGERIRIEIEAGSVDLDDSLSRHASAASALPQWLQRASGGDLEQCAIPIGTPVEISGGERSEIGVEDGSAGSFREAPHRLVLRGTAAAPMVLRFGARREAALTAAGSPPRLPR